MQVTEHNPERLVLRADTQTARRIVMGATAVSVLITFAGSSQDNTALTLLGATLTLVLYLIFLLALESSKITFERRTGRVEVNRLARIHPTTTVLQADALLPPRTDPDPIGAVQSNLRAAGATWVTPLTPMSHVTPDAARTVLAWSRGSERPTHAGR